MNSAETKIKKKERIVIIIRHGERADLAGSEVKLNSSDPELTEIGKSQAYAAGRRLKEILEEIKNETHSNNQVNNEKISLLNNLRGSNEIIGNDQSIKRNSNSISNKKIAIISSPFTRALETAKYIKNGMDLNLPIYIENGLSEFISKGWFQNSPKDFLCYYNLMEGPKDNLKVKIEKPEYFLNEMMSEVLIHQPMVALPDYPESTNSCIARFHNTLDLLTYYYLIRKDYDIIILVTHVFGLQSLCEKMEIPMDYFEIEYCSTFIFKYDQETGKYTFETNFYPILY